MHQLDVYMKINNFVLTLWKYLKYFEDIELNQHEQHSIIEFSFQSCNHIFSQLLLYIFRRCTLSKPRWRPCWLSFAMRSSLRRVSPAAERQTPPTSGTSSRPSQPASPPSRGSWRTSTTRHRTSLRITWLSPGRSCSDLRTSIRGKLLRSSVCDLISLLCQYLPSISWWFSIFM